TPAFTTEHTEGAAVSASASGPRRVRANRANARKSTGLKTSRGKRFSSANATKWGLAAGNGRHLMARLGEDPQAVDALRERLEERAGLARQVRGPDRPPRGAGRGGGGPPLDRPLGGDGEFDLGRLAHHRGPSHSQPLP